MLLDLGLCVLVLCLTVFTGSLYWTMKEEIERSRSKDRALADINTLLTLLQSNVDRWSDRQLEMEARHQDEIIRWGVEREKSFEQFTDATTRYFIREDILKSEVEHLKRTLQEGFRWFNSRTDSRRVFLAAQVSTHNIDELSDITGWPKQLSTPLSLITPTHQLATVGSYILADDSGFTYRSQLDFEQQFCTTKIMNAWQKGMTEFLERRKQS